MWILYADGAEFSVKYTHKDFVALRGTWGLWFFCMDLPRCVYQHKYQAATADSFCEIQLRRVGELTCPSGCGKRPQPCDLACHYTNLIPNSPSEFNFDTAEIQFVQEKWREEVITSVTRICSFLNKPWTEKMCLNFLLFCTVRIHAEAHTELPWRAT